MAKSKKPQTVDDIVNEYQKFHHAAGKSFKERIAQFEKFHDSENIHAQQLILHSHYVVFGKPTDQKRFPGAYNEAYKVLDKHASDDNDKIENEDKLAEILETYTDTFLQSAIGDKYKESITKAEKSGNLSKKDVRELKGQLMGQYHRDEKGNPLNILNEQYIKQLKGRKKIELITELQNISEKVKLSYAQHLHNEALEGLITDEDRIDLAEYIRPIFKEQGWKHKDDHVMRSAPMQAQHYGFLLEGSGEELKKRGYKTFKDEKKKAA